MIPENIDRDGSSQIYVSVSILLCCAVCGLFSGCAPTLQTMPWKSLGTPSGQNVTAFLRDVHDPQTVYSGSVTGGFLVSSNRGRSWLLRGTIEESPAVYILLQHPDNPSSLYAGTAGGFFQTSDGGTTWQSVAIVPGMSPQPACKSIAADAWDPMILYAGFTGHGVYGSTNGGVTWSSLNGDLDRAAVTAGAVEDIIAHPSRPGLLFAILSTLGALRTTDGGISWTELTGRFDASATTIARIIVSPDNADLLCIGTGGGDIYRSENGGQTWLLTHQGTGFTSILNFAFESESRSVYASTADGVLTSDNFGGTWTSSPALFPRLPARIAPVADSAGVGFYLYGGGAGVRYLPGGETSWIKADSGLSGSVAFTAVRTLNDGNAVIAASASSVYRHSDSGWVCLSEGLPGSRITAIATDNESDSLWYAASISGPYHTSNAGNEWKPLGNRMGGKAFSFIAAHPAITNRLIGMTESGLMVSTDNGSSWSRTKPPLKGYEIRSMTFHPANAGILGAGTSNHGALVSSDGGITWDESRYGLEGNEILTVTFSPGDQQTYFAWGSDGKGYRSTNKGIEWTMAEQPWHPAGHIDIAVDQHNPSSMVALVDRRDLYYSESGGKEWTKLPVAPPPSPMMFISWSGRSRMLYGVSEGEGLYRISLRKETESTVKK